VIAETPSDERAALLAHLRGALDAIERDDDAGWRAQMDALLEWRSRPWVRGLAVLAQELGQALGTVPKAEIGLGELPDAVARLDHVVEMTEKASLQTMDLAEHGRVVIDELLMLVRGDSESMTPSVPDASMHDMLGAVRRDLSDIVLAQTYQDLTGQIIRRVVGVVHRLHDNLVELGFEVEPDANSPRLAGPAVERLDVHAVSQNDADHLLSDLGI